MELFEIRAAYPYIRVYLYMQLYGVIFHIDRTKWHQNNLRSLCRRASCRSVRSWLAKICHVI